MGFSNISQQVGDLAKTCHHLPELFFYFIGSSLDFFFVKLFQSRVKQLKFFSKAYDRRIRNSRLIRHESWKAKLPTLDERIHVILLDNGDVLTT